MTIGIVSKFPPKGKRHTAEGALAGYTKNLVSHFPKENGDQIAVYADILATSDRGYYEDGVRVFRLWKKGILYPVQVLAKVLKHRPNIIHLQHEFFLYGGAASSIVFLLLLLGLKILGIPRITTIHGVVPLSAIDRDFVRENGSNLPVSLIRSAFVFLTKCICLLSSATVVHEKKFISLLKNEYKCNCMNCRVIPHGIETKDDGLEKAIAKSMLGLENKQVILFFGYITAYKGLDLLVESFNLFVQTNPDSVLVIAGGEHPRLSDFVIGLKSRALRASASKIIFTGFLPEDKIALYFSAADLVVFPYTVGMSSSGSMALAIAYKKPFIVADAFRDIIDLDEAVFERDPLDLADKIKKCLDDESIQNKLVSLSERIKEERVWDKVSKSTYNFYSEVLTKPNRIRI